MPLPGSASPLAARVSRARSRGGHGGDARGPRGDQDPDRLRHAARRPAVDLRHGHHDMPHAHDSRAAGVPGLRAAGLAARGPSPPWPLSTWPTGGNAAGFPGRHSSHPARADLFHSLPGVAAFRGSSAGRPRGPAGPTSAAGRTSRPVEPWSGRVIPSRNRVPVGWPAFDGAFRRTQSRRSATPSRQPVAGGRDVGSEPSP